MRHVGTVIAVVTLGSAGCSGLRHSNCPGTNGCDYDREAKTLLAWAVCKEDGGDGKNEEKGKENGAGKENGNGAEKKNGSDASLRHPAGLLTPAAYTAEAGANGNGSPAAGNGNGEPEEEDTIVTDRPDFTEASSTVGRGRVQLEAGYTYARDRADGLLTRSHSYPEVLIRAGVFADWFELRLGQNFGTVRTPGPASDSGAEDLYLGVKLALTEQKGVFPETAFIVQTTVPSGARAFTANKVNPGLSLLYGWDLSDRWTLAGSALGNAAVDPDGHKYVEFANSLSVGHSWTDKVGGYFEYFAFYPHGATAAGVRPEYYLNGGFTYLFSPDVQFDVRAGFGLNRSADDFFAGSGFAVRY